MPEAKTGIRAYLRLYNDERPHKARDYQTPHQMLQAGCSLLEVRDGRRETNNWGATRKGVFRGLETGIMQGLDLASGARVTYNAAGHSLNLASTLSQ